MNGERNPMDVGISDWSSHTSHSGLEDVVLVGGDNKRCGWAYLLFHCSGHCDTDCLSGPVKKLQIGP